MRAYFAVAVLVSSQVAAAALPSPTELRGELAPYLAKPLPSVASIVGIAMPKASPLLVVASFGDKSLPADRDRGYAVGRTLNELLFGAHADLDVEMPQYYSLDTSEPGILVGRGRDSRGNAYRVAAREAAQWCVHGSVDGDAKSYRISVVVDRCAAGSAAVGKTFVVASEAAWPSALRDMCEHVVTVAAGMTPRARTACARGEAVRAGTFLAYANFATTTGMPRERLATIVADDPAFAPAALDFIERLPDDQDRAAFFAKINATVAAAGKTPAVTLAAYSRQLKYVWKIEQRPFSDLIVLIRANPQLRGAWLTLASGLAQTVTWDYPSGNVVVEWAKEMLAMEGARYYPNATTHAASLALSLDYYANWPDSYRARWQMGYAIMQYAWMVRGNETWSKVPRSGRRAFRPLMRIADKYTVAAIDAQPGAATLWANRIITVYHSGDDWLEMFDQAAQRHPHAAQVYEAAMLYAQEKWGGSDVERIHIQNAAVRNNPEAAWAKTLIERYAATGTL